MRPGQWMPPQTAEPRRQTRQERPRSRADPLGESLERRWHTVSRYPRRARVTAVDHLTPTGTVHLRFEVVDDEPFAFEPGQFVGIQARFEPWGYRRSPYCIYSPPNDERTFELLVRVVADGPLSQYLASRQEGDMVAFRGPTGRSMLPSGTEREIVLLATGVGIAPFMSLARHLLAAGSRQPIRLYWGLRLVEDICCTDDLDDLAASHPSFRYAITLSQPGPRWTGLRGRLTESFPPLLDSLDKHFYLCGNGAMTEELAAVLNELGVARDDLYEEPYFNRRHDPDPRVLDSIRRRFAFRDLVSPVVDPDKPLFPLDAPLAAGPPRHDPPAA